MPEILTLQVGSTRYGVPRASVGSLEPLPRLTHLPRTASGVTGCALVDEHALVVLDLGACLGYGETCAESAGQQLLRLASAQASGGFALASEAAPHLEEQTKTFALPQSLDVDWISGGVLRDGELVPLLDLPALSSAVERGQAFPPRGACRLTAERSVLEAHDVGDVDVYEVELPGGYVCALAADEVVGVPGAVPRCDVPTLSPPIVGLAICEDELVPVVDLARALGVACPRDTLTRALLVDTGRLRALVLVSDVLGQRHVPRADQRPLPRFLEPARHAVSGCYVVEKRVGLQIDLERLVTHFDPHATFEIVQTLRSTEASPPAELPAASATQAATAAGLRRHTSRALDPMPTRAAPTEPVTPNAALAAPEAEHRGETAPPALMSTQVVVNPPVAAAAIPVASEPTAEPHPDRAARSVAAEVTPARARASETPPRRARRPWTGTGAAALLVILLVVGAALVWLLTEGGASQSQREPEPPTARRVVERPREPSRPAAAPAQEHIARPSSEPPVDHAASTSARRARPAGAPRTVRYVVQPGDSLWSILVRHGLDPFTYATLARENGIANPDRIDPGVEIELWVAPAGATEP